MNEVEVVQGEGKRPFMVKVNGQLLRESRNQVRRFKTSFNAAIAGAREADRLRLSQGQGIISWLNLT